MEFLYRNLVKEEEHRYKAAPPDLIPNFNPMWKNFQGSTSLSWGICTGNQFATPLDIAPWKDVHPLFHTGKNTSFFSLYYFLREPKVMVCLLTDLATLSHHHCALTMVAQAQKKRVHSLVQKPICCPFQVPTLPLPVAQFENWKKKEGKKNRLAHSILSFGSETRFISIITIKVFNIEFRKTIEILFPSCELWFDD